MLRRLAILSFSLLLSTQAFADQAAPRTALAGDVAYAPRRASEITPAMRARLRTVLAARRARNVAAFAAYAKAGVYPHVLTTTSETDGGLGVEYVWTDGEGHRCAAASMIWASGAHALVTDTAKTHNDVRLAHVDQGPLRDWMLMSGLTTAEIDAIQQPFLRPPTSDMFREADARLRAK